MYRPFFIMGHNGHRFGINPDKIVRITGQGKDFEIEMMGGTIFCMSTENGNEITIEDISEIWERSLREAP